MLSDKTVTILRAISNGSDISQVLEHFHRDDVLAAASEALAIGEAPPCACCSTRDDSDLFQWACRGQTVVAFDRDREKRKADRDERQRKHDELLGRMGFPAQPPWTSAEDARLTALLLHEKRSPIDIAAMMKRALQAVHLRIRCLQLPYSSVGKRFHQQELIRRNYERGAKQITIDC